MTNQNTAAPVVVLANDSDWDEDTLNPCRFAAHVEDQPTSDRFKIQIFNRNGKQIHQADGALGGGAIQIH